MAAPETATATRPAPTLDPALLAAPAPPTTRLLALDVFRGMTVAGMLLVNNPGSWGAIYPPLEHAPWNGWTPTDLIFPFFLFIAGVTTHLSLSVRRARGDDDAALRRQILRRGALIVLERETGLEEVAETGVMLHADLSAELLQTIFAPHTPLHDGAVIVREDRVLAAGAVLPLAETTVQEERYGTRHRAALGITEQTDALVLVDPAHEKVFARYRSFLSGASYRPKRSGSPTIVAVLADSVALARQPS